MAGRKQQSAFARYLNLVLTALERCWPGVIGGLVAGFLVTGALGSLFGAMAAAAGTVGGTWLFATRGKRARVTAMPGIISDSLAAMPIVGVIFAAYVFLSWAKWLIALAAAAVLAWAFLKK